MIATRNPLEAQFEEVRGIWQPREEATYRRWRVEIRCTDLILGGAPKSSDVLLAWLRSRFDEDDDVRAKLLEHVRMQGIDTREGATFEAIQEQLKSLGDEQHGNGFLQDGQGLFVPTRCLKSFVKEAANTRFAGESWGPGHTRVNKKSGETEVLRSGFKGVKSVVAERVMILGAKTHALKKVDGAYGYYDRPDGTLVHVGHPTGPRGPVSTLTYFDYLAQPWFVFTLQAAPDFPSDDQIVETLVEGQFHGLWAGRSMGYGQFRVTAFDRL